MLVLAVTAARVFIGVVVAVVGASSVGGCRVSRPPSCGGSLIVYSDPPPLPSGSKYSLALEPLALPPHAGTRFCVWSRVDNTDEMKVHATHVVLSRQVARVVVYRDAMDTTEQTTPVPCEAPSPILEETAALTRIATVERIDDTIELPAGSTYTFAPTQMVKLEIQVANPGSSNLELTANVDFFAAD